MDEFLELMENDLDEVESPPPPVGNNSAFDANENENSLDDGDTMPDDNNDFFSTLPTNNDLDDGNSNERKSATDPWKTNELGLRMVQPQVSKVDLLEWLTSPSFYSPPALCAMSFKALSQKVLADPPMEMNAASMCGPTHVTTVGLVFSNSGTKISSKKGSAFCILNIGTLHSGPSVSVLLFGNAYGRFCRSCTPGKIVAIIRPRLIPKTDDKGNGRSGITGISFSIEQPDQLKLVATALDYGVCQAVRQSVPFSVGNLCGGGFCNDDQSNTNRKCRNYVDKRVSKYCDYHRRLQEQQQNAKQTISKLQAIRQEWSQTQFPTMGNKNNAMNHPYNSNNINNTNGSNQVVMARPQHRHQTNRFLKNTGNKYLQNQHQQPSQQLQNVGNKYLQNQQQQPQRVQNTGNKYLQSLNRTPIRHNKPTVPLRVADQEQLPPAAATAAKPATLSMTNTIKKKKTMSTPAVTFPHTTKRMAAPTNLMSRRNQQVPSNKMTGRLASRKRLNNDGDSFDGSVAIPKRQNFCFGNSAATTVDGSQNSSSHLRNINANKNKRSSHNQEHFNMLKKQQESKVREQQALLASKMNGVDTAAKGNRFGRTGSGQQQNKIGTLSSLAGMKTSTGTGINGTVKCTNSRLVAYARDKKRKQVGGGACNQSNGRPPNENDSKKNTTTTSSSSFADAFADIAVPSLSFDRKTKMQKQESSQVDDRIVHATSRFELEARAEDYAKSRRALVQLEQKEQIEEGRKTILKNKNGQKGGEGGRITKHYICVTCDRKRYNAVPTYCQKLGHQVQTIRHVEDGLSQTEKRTKLHTKDIDEGGLQIGAGLDWSRNRFSSII